MKTPTTIYTCTYGFNDSDAIGTVWGRTPKYAISAVKRAINETARSYANNGDGTETFTAIKNTIWYVGPFACKVSEIELDDPNRSVEFGIDLDTNTTGYVL